MEKCNVQYKAAVRQIMCIIPFFVIFHFDFLLQRLTTYADVEGTERLDPEPPRALKPQPYIQLSQNTICKK